MTVRHNLQRVRRVRRGDVVNDEILGAPKAVEKSEIVVKTRLVRINSLYVVDSMVRPERFELPTFWFVARVNGRKLLQIHIQ